jgi:hypothetical protein
MSNHARVRRTVTRRQFVGAGIAACSCCAIAGAGLAHELTPLAAPTADQVNATSNKSALQPTGAPILLLLRRGVSFGEYLGAILRAEGVVGYDSAQLDEADLALLRLHSVVLLSPGSLTRDQVDLLTEYVHGGGNLIAFQPDPKLATLMGVRYVGSAISAGDLMVSAHPIARGISSYPLQIHQAADHLQLAGAEVVARLNGASSLIPLVTLHRAGSGHAALWAFDLARSIAMIRQGDPSASGEDRDSVPGVRTQDSFVGWDDLDRLEVPQADEHQRLLVNMIEAIGGDRLLMPRLWYFPNQKRGVLIGTSDAHGISADAVARGLSIYEQYGGTGTVYYATAPVSSIRRFARRVQWKASGLPVVGWALSDDSGYPTQGHVQRWRERGHRFGLHPFVEEGVEQGYNRFYSEFVRSGYGEPDMSVRTHRTLWDGWVETAKVQARYGLRMNLDFYHAGMLLHAQKEKYMTGYLSGSGLPMPFVDRDGAILNIFQQHTHLVDEHLMPLYNAGTDIGLSSADAVTASRRMIDKLKRYPTAIGMQWHLDPLAFGGASQQESERWIHGTLAYARANDVPIMSAERWLQFTQMRSSAELAGYHWDHRTGRLAFTLRSPEESPDTPEILLPLVHSGQQLKAALINGVQTSFARRVVNGRDYASIAAQNGAQIECRYGPA